jgi:glucose-1-phosphate thymidylyltransferase
MLAGIRDFIVITSPDELSQFEKLFADSKNELGINVRCFVQERPIGIADSFRVVKSKLGDEINDFDVHALILGDNIFYGSGFRGQLDTVNPTTANIFVHQVPNPKEFGIAEIQESNVISLEEKPEHPKSNLAITGLYFYPKDVYTKVEQLVPSARGELEITDLNKLYLKENNLSAIRLLRGVVWIDTGLPESMLEAANLIHTVQKYQGVLVGSPHEIALSKKWVSADTIQPFINKCNKTQYGKYLQQMLLL